jgi:Flp pilus assembly protein TadG
MRRLHDQRGTSAVEFAIIISLVFIVLFGIIQFGIAYNRYQGINAAAREGARLASLKNSQVDPIQDRVLESLSILNPANFKNGSSRIYTCPATLATEKGCIEIAKEDTNNPGTFLAPLTSGTDIPCDTAQQNFTVKVTVKYRMLITIPLWASPAVNATGTGVFRCE